MRAFHAGVLAAVEESLGMHVIAFQPTAEDAAVTGRNPMDHDRRAAVARQARESTLRRLARAGTRARLRVIWI